MNKLTAKAVENAVAKKTEEYKMADGGGLFLRVRKSGAKSWIFLFRLPGKRKINKMTLGSLNDLSLKQARSKLPELRKLVSEGINPRNALAAVKAENAQVITMQMLFDSWIDFFSHTEKVTPKCIKQHQNRWRLHLKKPLGNLFAKDVTKVHLASALDVMSRKGIKEETRKALTTLNLMLDYGLRRHSIELNPARMLKPKDFAATMNRPRDRALTLAELRVLWLALDQSVESSTGLAKITRVNLMTATAIKLLILTGVRRGEMVGMSWSELNLPEGIWHLSSSRTKNKQAHTIYLSKLSISLLETLKPITGHSQFVFDIEQGEEQKHIHKDTPTRAIKRLCDYFKNNSSANTLGIIKPFTIHDLRRSAATAWGEHLKVNPHVIERMLNHQPLNKLMATYQRAEYAEEQKLAWLAWGEFVEHNICTIN